ncbi:MAG: TrkA family potassium uptake protein [Planctomycetales bacterium]|nr:TrkA family potassium uptake protein [Planctomycetales bacterium]
MADHRKFVVLGLGTFGAAVARQLSKNRCRVTGVDQDEQRVNELKETLYEAIIADVTDPDALSQVGLADAEGVIIALGEDITLSLLAALHTKELGGKRIVVKGVTVEHGKLLKHLGVERVVFPEVEMARQLADSITWPNMLDLLQIDRDYSVMEIAVPDSCVGETIRSVDLRKRFGAWVVGVKDVLTGKLEMFPDPEYRFGQDQLLLVIGKDAALKSLREMS